MKNGKIFLCSALCVRVRVCVCVCVQVAYYRLYGRVAEGSNVKVRLSDKAFPGLGTEVCLTLHQWHNSLSKHILKSLLT